jgi:murein hydrolase activator
MMKLFSPKGVFAIGITLFISIPLPVFCQTSLEDVSKDPSKELQKIHAELEKTKPRMEKLKTTTASLNRESTLLQNEIRRSTGRLRDLESQQNHIENQIAGLQEQSATLKSQLDGQKQRLNRVLSAMSRLSMAPKTPLGTTPLTPEATIRTAVLLRSLNTQLSQNANVLKKDLLQIEETRNLLEKQRTILAKNELDLRAEKVQLDGLLTQRKNQLSKGRSNDNGNAPFLKKDAVDIEALIQRLYEEDKKRQKNEKKQPNDDDDTIALSKLEKSRQELEKKKASLSQEDYDQKEATLTEARNKQIAAMKSLSKGQGLLKSSDFETLKGTLPLPVIGTLAQGTDQFQKGSVVKARSGSVVIAPVNARVIYAGAFRNYGQMVILSPSEGYHIILAGFNTLDTITGETLTAGEPVGRFKENDSEAPVGGSTLYVEMRKNQITLDPRSWFAETSTLALKTRTNNS